ncbi:unnamed protein product [Miscanthus lutarioriparius]|uniref:Flavin-containing monooxygenase n=1 Tax=Miscanthus lutarioriparius TaxID=422564 RepID=A0A811N6M1_9POAL|nr:unnamed protein product [Miscanthus lutarioriparius]
MEACTLPVFGAYCCTSADLACETLVSRGIGGGMVSSKKVCVVGAGVSGLVSARELRREGHDVTVMEQSDSVGGQWLYEPRTDANEPLGAAGVHSGVYASLRLNAPRDSMCFSDFSFYPKDDGTGDARRYPGHAEFLRYIRDFCDAFGLTDVVRLNTKRHGDCEGEVVTTEEVFEAVVVATGQYSQPRIPAINGMDKWRRRQLHSHSYRVPGSFRDAVVVVVGLGESGKEIALELREVAREIECLCADGQVTFADGSCVVTDSIMYCTVYDYSFPFLDTGGLQLTVDDNRIGQLYSPSLSFVGEPSQVKAPRFYLVQARWVAQVLSGRRPLPSAEEMLRSAEEYHRAREMAGVPRRLSHALFLNLEYCDEFGEKRCGFPRLPEWKKELMRAAVARLRNDQRHGELP